MWRFLLIFAAGCSAAAIGASKAAAVLGGNAVRIEAAPWVVAVLSPDPTLARAEVCTGVIVDARHVVTAAHCIRKGPYELTVRAGVSNYERPARGDREEQRTVASYRILPDRVYADVAVLDLFRPLSLDGVHVRPIGIRRASTWRRNLPATLIGFGLHARTRTGSLTQIKERIDDQGRCGFLTLTGAQAALWICGHTPTGGSCFGDSGAGLVSAGPHPALLGILRRSLLTSGCAPGETDQYTYTGAPEVWRFIAGDDQPPLAPRHFSLVVLGWSLRVGGFPVICGGSSNRSRYRTRYSLSVGGRTIRTSSSEIDYTVRRLDSGKQVVCVGSATNAGGTSRQSWTMRVAAQ